MRSLRFALSLVIVVLLHAIGVRVLPGFSQAVDLFLVLVLFNAVNASLGAGLLGGLAAGMVADALTGSLYGLHGAADTLIGYGAALASQRLVIQRPATVMLLFAVAAVAQQALLFGLRMLLLADPSLPDPAWLVARVLTVGILGLVGYAGQRQFASGVEKWRRTRRSRLRWRVPGAPTKWVP